MDAQVNLVRFQIDAVDKTVEAISCYDHGTNLFSHGQSVSERLRGKPKPYLHKIKAITGAGKTPILAGVAGRLNNCIIVWMTPRRAIIEQTTENLRGKYKNLLDGSGDGTTTVMQLDEALGSVADWTSLIEADMGRSVITTTIGAFNQDQDKTFLNIHKGLPSPWEQLCSARRPLYVFYDEGHNATTAQFSRIEELMPVAMIMASASPLSAELYRWIPGENEKDKEHEVNEKRTTKIKTSDVVSNGLLKKVIKIFDLETSPSGMIEQAVNKWRHLSEISAGEAIACYIVDSTEDGLRVWDELAMLGRKNGVATSSIAVHLSGAKGAAAAAVKSGKSHFSKLVATYDDNETPATLRQKGFKHIIWNLSLEEGWDEPWAYVGYFHGEQASPKKVVQRIGRLIRNPFKTVDGIPVIPAEEELQSVFCFLRTKNDVLKLVVENLRKEMDTSGIEIAVSDRPEESNPSIDEAAIKMRRVPNLCICPNRKEIETTIMNTIFSSEFQKKDCQSPGRQRVLSVEVGGGQNEIEHGKLPRGVPSTAAEIVKAYLDLKDHRLIRAKGGSTGGWVKPSIWDRTGAQQKVDVGSRAYSQYRERCDHFVDEQLDMFIEIINDGEEFEIKNFKLINPDGGSAPGQKKYYKRHFYKNAVHGSYNGLNDFEVMMAECLDSLGVDWARNPSRTGFGIPLPRATESSTTFYPDFIAWKDERTFLIETKGSHLIEEAKKERMIDLPKDFCLALFSDKLDAYLMFRKSNGRVNKKSAGDLMVLVKELLGI